MAVALTLFLLTISVSDAYFVLDNNGTLYPNRSAAEKACKALNRDLASIHSLDDVDTIIQLLIDNNAWIPWIGLQRSDPGPLVNASNDDFHWTDGTPFDYIKWFGDSADDINRKTPNGHYEPGEDNRCALFLGIPFAPPEVWGYFYIPCDDVETWALCNGQPTKPVEYCCTSNVPEKVVYFRKCAAKKTENQCVKKIDKDSNEPKCKWMNCESAGYCKFNGVDDIIRRPEKKICGRINNEVDCIMLGFCEWQKGMPPPTTPDKYDEYGQYEIDDIEEEEFMVKNGYLNNFMMLNGDENYYNNLLLLFILFGGIIFICYQIYSKCISSLILKNEYESIV